MATLLMPFRADIPSYRMQVELDQRLYFFDVRYNKRMSRWILSLYDEDEVAIAEGIPILINQNLFYGFRDDRLPKGILIAVNEDGLETEATRYDLGSTVNVYYEEPSE